MTQAFPAIRLLKSLTVTEKTSSNPRVLVVEVVLESYTGPVTCLGEIHYFLGNPSFSELRWYDWDCIGHNIIIRRARQALSSNNDPDYACHTQGIALVLQHWVKRYRLDINQIPNPEVRTRVNQLLAQDDSSAASLSSCLIFPQPGYMTWCLKCQKTRKSQPIFCAAMEHWICT